METTLDKFGRIIIPKDVRAGMGLEPGAVFQIEKEGEKIILQPIRGGPQVVEKKGILVFSGAAAGDVGSAIREHRQSRLKKMSPER